MRSVTIYYVKRDKTRDVSDQLKSLKFQPNLERDYDVIHAKTVPDHLAVADVVEQLYTDFNTIYPSSLGIRSMMVGML